MGLDMSLYACRSMVFENDSIFDEIKKFITIPFPNATLNNIQVEVMSWRKANAIHNWFINNCTNGVKYQLIEKLRDEFLDMCNEAHLPDYCEWCYPTQVFIGQLVKLRDICKEVLDHSELVPAKITDSYTYQLSPSGVLVEKANMVAVKEYIINKLNKYGFKVDLNIDLISNGDSELMHIIEEEKVKEIPVILPNKKEESKVEEKKFYKSKKSTDITFLNDILYEIDNINIEAKIFGIEYFEAKSGYKIITLKLDVK